MNETSGYKFGIKADRLFESTWSFGCCLSHALGETYLFINFLFWSVSIGWFEVILKESEAENEADN